LGGRPTGLLVIRLTGDDWMGNHTLGTWLYRGVATAKLVIVKWFLPLMGAALFSS